MEEIKMDPAIGPGMIQVKPVYLKNERKVWDRLDKILRDADYGFMKVPLSDGDVKYFSHREFGHHVGTGEKDVLLAWNVITAKHVKVGGRTVVELDGMVCVEPVKEINEFRPLNVNLQYREAALKALGKAGYKVYTDNRVETGRCEADDAQDAGNSRRDGREDIRERYEKWGKRTANGRQITIIITHMVRKRRHQSANDVSKQPDMQLLRV